MRWSFFPITVFLASARFAGAQQLGDDRDSQQHTRQVQLWDRIKTALQAPNGSEYFRYSLQDAMIPGNIGGVVALRGTVISREPPDHPTVLTVAMSDDNTADVTLRVVPDSPPPFREPRAEKAPSKSAVKAVGRNDITTEDLIQEWRQHGLQTDWHPGPPSPMPAPKQATAMIGGEPVPGDSVEFEGLARVFSPDPFMLTFEVSASKVLVIPAKK